MKQAECSRTSGSGRPVGLAQHNGDRLLVFVLHAVGDDPARTKPRGQVGLGQPVDELLAAAAVADQRLDGDDLQVELLGQGVKLVARGPIAALAEDFDQCAGRFDAGHPGQIDGALGMPGTPQHAALLGHQRIKMARPHEVGRLGVRVEDLADRPGPFLAP